MDEMPDLDPEIRRALQATSPPDWILEMQRYYVATGTHRAEDIFRFCGDPALCVRSEPIKLPAYSLSVSIPQTSSVAKPGT
jgi:hypothetical protein